MGNKLDTILIEIAAYCDPELLNTISSAIIQADYPERVHFSVCYQSDNIDDLNAMTKIPNCKIVHLKEAEARGSVYARFLCQKLLDNEKYIFQIDSHMRFVKHWDTKIINQLESLNDKKAILSVYPPFCTEEMMSKPLDDEIYDNPAEGGVMYTNGFRDPSSHFLQCNSIPIKNDDYRAYKKNAFIAAGNFFTYAEAHKTVIHDKEMYFYGDELPMSIRLFTHGWNVYNPGECYVYHQYERKNQKFPPVNNAMLNESKRLSVLLNLEGNSDELGQFGLGTERTLQEYEEFAGINFKKKMVYMNAETGEFENPDMKNKISYLQQKQSDKHQHLVIEENIEIMIIDPFNEYKDCVKQCLSKSKDKSKVSFIIATKDKKKPTEKFCNENNIKKLITIKEKENYTQTLSKLVKYLGDSYVALIDSSMRFTEDWEVNLTKALKLCGEKSALTSWVWQTSPDTDVNNFFTYNNVIKELDTFYNYIPYLKFNEKIDLSKRNTPYHTPYISDGFIFTRTSTFKDIPIDPTLTYEEHQYLYALRLWTNGYDIYYPTASNLIRTRAENELHEGVNNMNIVCALTGLSNYYSKSVPANYKYDIGTVRPLWQWYDFMNVKYDPNSLQIIEDKKGE